MSAGYSKRSLVDKLGIRPGASVLFVDPPDGYDATLGHLPPGVKKPPERWGLLTMHGPSVFRFAVNTLVKIIPEAIEAAGMTLADADLVILHQSNMRIIEKVRSELGLSAERCPAVIQATGNTSGGSVGMTLDAVRRQGGLRPGMIVVYASVGGGLCWGASVWRA